MIRVDKSLPELSFLLDKQSLLPHPLLIREVLQSLNPFVAFSWTPSSVCVSHTGHWDAQNWAVLLWVVEGKITSVTLLLQPMPLAWCVAHCWLLFSSRTPGPSLPRGFPAGWLQDISVYMGLFSAAHFSSLQRSLWMAAGPTGVSATPSFVSPAALLRACSAHHP